jgi:hypothetical protein
MDLLECPSCTNRFLVPDAGTAEGWLCRHCGRELRLIVRSLSGDLARLRQALRAETLSPSARERPSRETG